MMPNPLEPPQDDVFPAHLAYTRLKTNTSANPTRMKAGPTEEGFLSRNLEALRFQHFPTLVRIMGLNGALGNPTSAQQCSLDHD